MQDIIFKNTQSKKNIAQVIVPMPVFEPFDYLIPDSLDVEVGQIVRIPIGSRRDIGLVIKITDTSPFPAH